MLVVSDNSPVRYLRLLDCARVLPILFGHILIIIDNQFSHPACHH
jgi:hypothetical protein